MLGQMMDQPLLISSIARHADRRFADQEIVSFTVDNPRHRYTYRDAFSRVRKLANALARHGVEQGDRIGTMAWNDYRHFELYYGVSGSGLVCHTINPRLFEDQLVFIINDASDKFLSTRCSSAPSRHCSPAWTMHRSSSSSPMTGTCRRLPSMP